MDKINAVAVVAPFPPPYGGMAVQAGRLIDGLTSSGAHCIRVNSAASVPTRLSLIKGIRTLFRLGLLISDLKTIRNSDVVHLFGASYEYFFLVVIPATVLSKLYKKKLILNYRGGGADRFFDKFRFIVYPVIKKADKIVVPSGFLKDVFRRHGIDDVIVIPNISDNCKFMFRQRSKLKPRILVTRNLEPHYNVSCALKAFHKIRERRSEAIMIIAGTGTEESRLKAMAREMNLDGVTFLGAVPNEQLPAIYEQSDIFMNPSATDNFPGSILESWASGVPVVTTNAGGIPWMVTDYETGLISEVNNADQLANNVNKLLDDPELSRRLSSNGREASSRYEWENVKALLLDAYAR